MKKSADSHVVLEGSHRPVLAGARATGRVNPHATIKVLVKLRRKKLLPQLTGRPKTIMTREELGTTYGASTQDIDAVTKEFKQFGLKVVQSSQATRTLIFSGQAASMEEAFLVKLFNYTHPDGSYRGHAGPVRLPAKVQNIVKGVFGLDNRRVARRRRHAVNVTHTPILQAHLPSSWYTSGQLAAHYDYPPGDGTGQCVGILEFGGGYFPADLTEYCRLANVPLPTVKAISTDGTSTSARDGAEGEVMLDIEVVAGVCPKATIAVYFAQWGETGWITALDAAMQDQQNNPGVITVSWGAPEDTDVWSAQAMEQVNETLQEAGHLGVTVCIAAGDDGSSDADLTDGLAHVDFPGSSPYVLAVGGTTIPSKDSTQPDIVWFEGDGLRPTQQGDPDGGSTGGGVSTVFPRPPWQSAITIQSVNPGTIVGRIMPDLAANADWTASPYLLVVDGQSQGNGGTSAATPLVASLVALINASLPAGQRAGYLTPLLYQSSGSSSATLGSTCCTDVVSGSNGTAKAGGYSAGKGYDAASGWGTPDGAKLLSALSTVVSPPAAANRSRRRSAS